MHKHLSSTATALAILLTTGAASAAEPTAAPAAESTPDSGASAGGEVSLSGGKFEASGKRSKADESSEPWIKRHRPTRNQMELGIFGGIMLPNAEHELYDPSINNGLDWQSYKKIAPDIGLRFGYYPLSFLGIEVEGGVLPTKLRDGSSNALLGTFRGYGILQLPYRIAPFALLGFGVMGSNGSSIGNDVDPALHFGGGVKFYINRLLALRLDVRDNATAQHNVDAGRTHHVEVLLGLSLLLNRKKPAPKVDGDADGDGFLDSVDKCVNVPGVAPDGCPPPDTDGDGILDPDDKCIKEPEVKNNYKDADGCPDEVPKAVVKFSGVIKGIYFDVDKDTIKKSSKKTLDESIAVLKEHDDVRLEISGHTDSDGNRDHNVDLSARRAEAVKKYLIDAGIAASRLTSRGAGPDEPVADNKTKAGKALNRRIEFKLLSGK